MRGAAWAMALFMGSALLGSARGDEEEDENAVAEGDEEPEEPEVQLTPKNLKALHKKFDKNRDGKVSIDELLQFSRSMVGLGAAGEVSMMMQDIDTSKDGKLSLEEWLVELDTQVKDHPEEIKNIDHRKKVEAAKFKASDSDKDGLLDVQELVSFFFPETNPKVLDIVVKDIHKTKDKDKDGKLSPIEFWAALDPSDDEGPDDDLHEDELADFRRLDADGDGGISVKELKAWESGHFHTDEVLMKMFQAVDKNRDNHITAAELAASTHDVSNSAAKGHLADWIKHHEL
mmetsp:Transcript_4088/g.11623  ORF Transcript_4088/g.11623 Transcript_4088/m.11623 type:complete len:288 (+) Transcript_4088:75-938(+)